MKPNVLHLLDKNKHVTAILAVTVGGDEVLSERLTRKALIHDLLNGVDESESGGLLSMLYLITANDDHRDNVAALTNPRYRNIKTRQRSVIRGAIHQYLDHVPEPTEESMDDFESFMRASLKSAKQGLGLPAENMTEFSYPVTTAVLNAASDKEVGKYLDQVGTEGPIMSGQISKVLEHLEQMDSAGFESLSAALLGGKTQSHLSVMAIEGTGRDMAVAIVNPQGRILRLSIRRFELLIENINTTRSLGDFVREISKGDYHQTYINTKIPIGEVLARYTSQTSTISAAVICARKGDVEDVADFILDADAIVCTYLAAKRLRQDFTRFIALRDEAGSRIDFDPFN